MESSIILKMIVGFLTLLVVVRLLGKKELSQLTPVDLIYLLVLGGLLEESIYDEGVPFWKVPYAAFLWAGLIFLFDLIIRKFDWLRPVLKGKPTVLVRDGELDVEALRKTKFEAEQLRSLLRMQGIFTLTEVKYAVLEPSGDLSVMQKLSAEKKDSFSYLLVDEGRIIRDALDELDVDEQWVRTQLEAEGYPNLKQVFYAEWSEENGFCVVGYE